MLILQHKSIEEAKQEEMDQMQGGAGARRSGPKQMSGGRRNERASSKIDAIKKSQQDQDKFVNKSMMDNND